MKKILLLFVMCALLPRVAGAQTPTDDTFTVSDLTSRSGGTYSFDVGLSGSRIYCAYNLDIYFPSGITVARDASDNLRVSKLTNSSAVYPVVITYDYDENDEEIEIRTYPHQVSCSLPEPNHLRVACSENTNKEFTKTSGSLFRVFVTLDDATLTASFSPKPIVKLSGLNLTTSAAVKYVPADFACRPFTTGIPASRTLGVNVLAANKIGTLILPFNVALPSGLKAYSCNAAEDDLLTLTAAESIEACKPYIVYAENGYSGSLNGTVDMSADYGTTDVFSEGYLTGVLSSTTVSTGYILQNQGDGPLFYDAEGVTFSLPAGRCYLITPSGAGIKAFGFDFDDDATGIDNIINYPLSIANFFDLQGRRVSSPTRGIYIQGTRKVIIK